MNVKRRWRLIAVIALLLSMGSAVALCLYALRQNINLFYTPTQVVQGEVPKHYTFRLGGMVTKGSLQQASKGLRVSFVLTDFDNTVTVDYEGILPDLFREGQGVVAMGQMEDNGHFKAQQVLAKHDEKYMPPEVAAILKNKKAKT